MRTSPDSLVNVVEFAFGEAAPYKFTGRGNHEWLHALGSSSSPCWRWSPRSANLPPAEGLSSVQVDRCGFPPFVLVTPIRSSGSTRPGGRQTTNPVLQDIGLAIHPRFSTRYVGCSISFAVAALIDGRTTRPGRR